MQSLREELKRRDHESVMKQGEYETRIQEMEARLHQERVSKEGGDSGEYSQEEMQLIDPETEATLDAVAMQQRAAMHNKRVELGTRAGRSNRRYGLTFQSEHSKGLISAQATVGNTSEDFDSG